MYLLDSTALIEIIKASSKGQKVKEIIGELPITFSSITSFEILAGSRTTEKEKISNVMQSAHIFPFDHEAGIISAAISRQLKETGKTVQPLDIFIAAVALKNDLTIITLDSDFERIPNLKTIVIK
ncbi:MAG: type II toxin-antitoxin system VapC family toxin [Candidatus Micrarchaeota archaeon]|nr:type II toxin-antitoxin system VapC family toxin [Candidatus Micrarchaeota archaeon]